MEKKTQFCLTKVEMSGENLKPIIETYIIKGVKGPLKAGRMERGGGMEKWKEGGDYIHLSSCLV